jgi:serine/threonine-protein kinase
MSPEQSFGEKTVDHRTDMWSIGVMLYEALAGTRPIEGENKGRVLHRLATEAITPIEVLMPDLPAEVAELVGRMLMRDPEDRPKDLREVHAGLAKYGTVKVQSFDAATNERRLVIDSSPFSARSSPRAVMPMADVCDPRATTYADAPVSSAVSPPLEAERTEAAVAARRSGARPWFVAASVIGLVALGASAAWLFLGRTAPANEAAAPPPRAATKAQNQQPVPQVRGVATVDPQASGPALSEPRLPSNASQQPEAPARPTAPAGRTASTRAAAPPKPIAAPNASGNTAPRTLPDDAVEGLVDQPPF